MVANGSRFCNYCGHSFASGLRAPNGTSPPCAECGYDLTGLNSCTCPECGSSVGKAMGLVRPPHDAAVRDALGRPLVGGMAGCFVLIVLSMARRSGAVEGLGLELLCALIGAAVCTALVWAVERVLDADDAPLWLTAARSTSAYLIVRTMTFVLLPVGSMRFGMVSAGAATFVVVLAASVVYWLWDEDSAHDSFARGVVIALPAAGLFPLMDLLL